MTGWLQIMLSIPLAFGSHAVAPAADDFAYRWEKTPEEGPVDPAIARRYSQRFRTCIHAQGATADLLPCYEQEFRRQDAMLQRAWPVAMHRLATSRRPALRAAERQWIARRDPFCERFIGGLRGSLVSVAYLDCRIELTVRRTIWLEQL